MRPWQERPLWDYNTAIIRRSQRDFTTLRLSPVRSFSQSTSNDISKNGQNFAAFYGAALRMINKKEESLQYLRAALETGKGDFSDTDKASIWLDIAFAEDKGKNVDDAVELAAKRVIAYTKDDSSLRIQASALIARLTLQWRSQSQCASRS